MRFLEARYLVQYDAVKVITGQKYLLHEVNEDKKPTKPFSNNRKVWSGRKDGKQANFKARPADVRICFISSTDDDEKIITIFICTHD